MQNVQNQMFTIIQDMQRKVNEMYVDWKAAGFGSCHVESNTKWINVRIEHYLIYFLKIKQ